MTNGRMTVVQITLFILTGERWREMRGILVLPHLTPSYMQPIMPELGMTSCRIRRDKLIAALLHSTLSNSLNQSPWSVWDKNTRNWFCLKKMPKIIRNAVTTTSTTIRQLWWLLFLYRMFICPSTHTHWATTANVRLTNIYKRNLLHIGQKSKCNIQVFTLLNIHLWFLSVSAIIFKQFIGLGH